MDCVVDEAALADLMSRLHGKDAAALLAEGAELLASGVPSEEAAAAPAPCAGVQEVQDGDSDCDSCESDVYPLFDWAYLRVLLPALCRIRVDARPAFPWRVSRM